MKKMRLLALIARILRYSYWILKLIISAIEKDLILRS